MVKKNAFVKEVRTKWPLFIMMLPVIVFLLIFNYLPMVGTLLAFMDYTPRRGFFGSDWVGLRNFQFLFRSGDALIIARNTILYNVGFIVLGTIFALFLAIAINELRGRLVPRVHQTIILLPYFLSWTVVSYFVYTFLSYDMGVLNSILNAFGRDSIIWYNERRYWPFILTFLGVWKGVGYSSVFYLSSIMSIDTEYYEASLVDGANKWQQIWNITLPHLMPIVTILFLLSVGSIFNSDFGLFFVIPRQNGLLLPVTQTIDVYVYNALIRAGNIGMSAAAGFFQSVVGFICVMTANTVIKIKMPDYALF